MFSLGINSLKENLRQKGGSYKQGSINDVIQLLAVIMINYFKRGKLFNIYHGDNTSD